MQPRRICCLCPPTLTSWPSRIGAPARPDDIRFTAALPKTRSGKIMRRLLRDIPGGQPTSQDVTAVEDYSVLATPREQDE
jgi:acetyl-CoA synthetase